MVSPKDVYDLFRKSGFASKAYLRIKFRIFPVQRIEPFFPAEGRIVDLGCGNGLFSFILKMGSARRTVVGIDLDGKKIKTAAALADSGPACEFKTGDIASMDYPPADVFSLIDVLYLIPFDAQERIIAGCRTSLSTGGRLIIKEMDSRPRWKYLFNVLQETLSVKILGLTLGTKFHFRSAADWRALLEKRGFSVTIERLDKGYCYPHVVIVARKSGSP